MRLAKSIIVSGAILLGAAAASAKTNTGGGGGDSSCFVCSQIVSLDGRPILACESTRFAGRKSCQVPVLAYDCTLSGDYCGFFFPSPNPVIA